MSLYICTARASRLISAGSAPLEFGVTSEGVWGPHLVEGADDDVSAPRSAGH
jgi:hypothetical protein